MVENLTIEDIEANAITVGRRLCKREGTPVTVAMIRRFQVVLFSELVDRAFNQSSLTF